MDSPYGKPIISDADLLDVLKNERIIGNERIPLSVEYMAKKLIIPNNKIRKISLKSKDKTLSLKPTLPLLK